MAALNQTQPPRPRNGGEGEGEGAARGIGARLREYVLLVRLHRPIGIFLLLWPVLWALWFAAGGVPELHVLAVFVLGTVLMRSAGCAVNDYADRDFDPHVARTRDRPLAAGRVRAREAMGVFVVLALIAFALVLTLNAYTIALSFVGAFLAASYPFMKRYTHLPQFYLGAAFGWGVPMAFAAQTGAIPPLAWVLFAATLLWAVAYDTAYAMVDRADDLRIGVKSTAILFGRADRALIALAHMGVLFLLALAGVWAGRGLLYAMGLGVAALLALYQQWLMRAREPKACFAAFLNNHYFGASVFAGLALDYLMETDG